MINMYNVIIKIKQKLLTEWGLVVFNYLYIINFYGNFKYSKKKHLNYYHMSNNQIWSNI